MNWNHFMWVLLFREEQLRILYDWKGNVWYENQGNFRWVTNNKFRYKTLIPCCIMLFISYFNVYANFMNSFLICLIYDKKKNHGILFPPQSWNIFNYAIFFIIKYFHHCRLPLWPSPSSATTSCWRSRWQWASPTVGRSRPPARPAGSTWQSVTSSGRLGPSHWSGVYITALSLVETDEIFS